MFIGHYAVGLAAKSIAPRAPLWTLVGASQFLDLGFSTLIMTGAESYRVDSSLPGNPFVLNIPWTHSLLMALVWSAVATGLARAFRMPLKVALVVGAVVFSHWILDFISHRPDLAFYPGGDPVLGLGFWNLPVPEMALEVGLLAVGGGIWVARREDFRQTSWPAILYLAFLVALAILFALPAPPPENAIFTGVSGLILFLFVTGIAWPVDRSWRPASK
ncbi:MAG: hypothetical protein K1X35_03230 [Caulobacteraceae bacterium]|nr:hypothetical protein [Caulobacteraceae bacterium]